MQIAPYLNEIIGLVGKHPVVSVVAPTGSGKSVGVPARIAATGIRCFVTVPTVTAARSLTNYQKVLQKETSTPRSVGYAAQRQVHYDATTAIVYVTGGHMRRKLLGLFRGGVPAPWDFCEVLMVDEIHTGSLDNTLILALWQRAYRARVRVPRLVVASATPAPLPPSFTPTLFEMKVKGFPVELRYLDSDPQPEQVLAVAAQYTAAQHYSGGAGHILVFAPGEAEVKAIIGHLQQELEEQGKLHPAPPAAPLVIPAYGTLQEEELAMIYQKSEIRKIIVATNIAETAITIADISMVVDTLLEKQAETSQSGGFRLVTQYISQDSAGQRAGRTGRTMPGTCLRLCKEETFTTLPQHRTPEVDRVPIYEPVMELLDAGLDPREVLEGVDRLRITRAWDLLSVLGMVTGGGVTEMGHFATEFPLGVRNSAFLYLWLQKQLPPFPGIVIATLIDHYGPSYFRFPRSEPQEPRNQYQERLKQHRERYFAPFIGYNDLETFLNLWSSLVQYLNGTRDRQGRVARYCRDHSLNRRKVAEMLEAVHHTVSVTKRLGYPVAKGPFTTAGAMTAARPLLLQAYTGQVLYRDRRGGYRNPSTKESFRLDNRDALNRMGEKPPSGVIALATAEIKTATSEFRVVGVGVDTDVNERGEMIKPPPERGAPAPSLRTPPAVAPVVAAQTQAQVDEALALLEELDLPAI